MTAVTPDRDFERLLEFVKQNRGFDFTGYKRTTLQRRVQKRMEVVGVGTYAAYLDQLTADSAEFTLLFNTLLINVTRFFRDDAPWQYLAATVIPAIIARVPESMSIRVWSAGCASGEEAYTLAILFAEALGMDRFRERVKIYGTDADDEALTQARLAAYDDEQVEGIPEELRLKYLERTDTRWAFRKDLRRAVIFGRNDLVQDAPISRIDLLVCRNTLMYFNAATQAAILTRFHFALADGGVLFLGRAETLLTHTNAFTPIDLKWRLFAKVPRVAMRDRLFMGQRSAPRDSEDGVGPRLREEAFEAGGESQVVVSRAGLLVMANERARIAFTLGRGDIGRPIQDLELSYRPVELRSLLERCYAERVRVVQREVQWRPRQAADDAWLTIEVSPLTEPDGTLVGASVVFRDITEACQLHQELEHSKQNLETAYEELQSTNEELETTNEELQSTVEELETTNEELQSTNEELETMNEELHSTNEELQTMNDEMRRRGNEVAEANDFLGAVFASMRGGVVVLDRELRVLVWNSQSEELWGVRAAEVIGTNFFSLDIGFPVDQLAGRIRAGLLGGSEDDMPVIEARNRRGRSIICRVGVSPLKSLDGAVKGTIVTMEEVGTPA
jgi:two-component system CheB/CheR fusion protein